MTTRPQRRTAEMGGRTLWSYRAIFVGLAILILFLALLPFGPSNAGIPGPELTLCLICAWVLRRPDYVPLWIIVPILLLDDVLMMRPLGLWTLVVIVVTDVLRRRVDHTEVLPFSSEIPLVAGWIGAAFILNYLALVVLLAETPPVAGLVLQAMATIVLYPFVALFSQMIGVRRLAPGELDTLGTRA
ncbi:MAG: rod shape-determining protein MreD [Pseudomonadota bacterium]